MNRGWAVLLLLLVLSGAAEVRAQTTRPYRVGLLGPGPVYSDPAATQPLQTPNLSYPSLLEEIGEHLDADPRFELVPDDQLRVRLNQQSDFDAASYVDYLRDNGIEQFGAYELDSAIDSLEQAVQRYRDLGSDITRPREVATAFEYLARAYLEKAQRDEAFLPPARRALKSLIRLHPNAEITPALYPESVVGPFREAYAELLFDDGADLAISTSSAQRVVQSSELDYLVAPYFIRTDESVRIVLVIFEGGSPSVQFRGAMDLTDATATSRDRASRLISQFMACIPLRYAEVEDTHDSDAGRGFLQAGWSFMFYRERPTEGQFLNQGISVLFDYHFNDNLGLFVRSGVFFGSRDADGDLLDGFTSVRTSLGFVLSTRISFVRIWLGLGMELNAVGQIRATEDFWCKVSGGDPVDYGDGRDCFASEVTQRRPEILMGALLIPGISFRLADPFSLYLNGNFAFYLGDVDDPVGFPFSGEAGLEYRF
ncbi:MAG: hypothetical protein KC561_04930 [Myxococcales bacterium]|nr:hypothetical protein [Myxococcales bacterium]